ncbi:MAG: ribbon-helix-helix protein, CopG family [Planctomycetes bacterium]|nr:ribbon-helix-helix protein, CopG family [Planctomycetota bacterium]
MIHTTTNLRLPKEMLKRLKLKAVEEGKSVSQLIREAIETYIFGRGHAAKMNLRSDPLKKIVGLCRSGRRDGSTAHDRYLYGKK